MLENPTPDHVDPRTIFFLPPSSLTELYGKPIITFLHQYLAMMDEAFPIKAGETFFVKLHAAHFKPQKQIAGFSNDLINEVCLMVGVCRQNRKPLVQFLAAYHSPSQTQNRIIRLLREYYAVLPIDTVAPKATAQIQPNPPDFLFNLKNRMQ